MFKQLGCLFCVMAQDATATLKAKIRELSDELDSLRGGPDHVPEFTIRANMLRQNDYLERSNRIREDIISTYADYSGILEDALRAVSTSRAPSRSMPEAVPAVPSDRIILPMVEHLSW